MGKTIYQLVQDFFRQLSGISQGGHVPHVGALSSGVSQVGLFFLALCFLIVAFATAISSLNHSLCLSCELMWLAS